MEIDAAVEPPGTGEGFDDVSASSEEATLARRHAPRIEATARRLERRYGLGTASRDDLVSAGQWGLLQGLRRRRPDAHPRELAAYLGRRIEGAIFDEVRRILGRRRWSLGCDPEDLDGHAGPDGGAPGIGGRAFGPDPERTLEDARRWRQVCRSLGEPGSEPRRLLLAYADGQSVAELAREDGSSPGRLQTRLARDARQLRGRAPELRRLLRDELE